jgi:hypothetical protein
MTNNSASRFPSSSRTRALLVLSGDLGPIPAKLLNIAMVSEPCRSPIFRRLWFKACPHRADGSWQTSCARSAVETRLNSPREF